MLETFRCSPAENNILLPVIRKQMFNTKNYDVDQKPGAKKFDRKTKIYSINITNSSKWNEKQELLPEDQRS